MIDELCVCVECVMMLMLMLNIDVMVGIWVVFEVEMRWFGERARVAERERDDALRLFECVVVLCVCEEFVEMLVGGEDVLWIMEEVLLRWCCDDVDGLLR